MVWPGRPPCACTHQVLGGTHAVQRSSRVLLQRADFTFGTHGSNPVADCGVSL